MMIQWYEIVYNNIQGCAVVYNGVLGRFPQGDLKTRNSDISSSLVHPGLMSGWMSFMESNIPWRLIFDWDITIAGTKNKIPT
jgi:hypothetical protein